MNIAVIAANGRTGKAFVAAALAAGHTLEAGISTLQTFHPHPRLREHVCDATISVQVTSLITGADAVVSFIGHVKGSSATVQTDAIRTIINAMNNAGTRRIVSLTGTGVRFPGDSIPLFDKLLNFSVSLIDPPRVNDGRAHVEVLKSSTVEWTVLRVLKLQNIPAKPFSLRQNGPTKLVVGREEVAQAALQVLEEASFINEAPIISPYKNP